MILKIILFSHFTWSHKRAAQLSFSKILYLESLRGYLEKKYASFCQPLFDKRADIINAIHEPTEREC